jgi:hypothetical protein
MMARVTSPWLIDETRPLTGADREDLDRELADGGVGTRSVQSRPTLAISLHDVVIHDTKKWFGEAEIRIDALVVTGYGQANDPQSFYMPKTQSFSRVRDGDRLPIGDGGLLVFHGVASHFVDLLIMVSRDRKDSDDLASLLASRIQAPEVQSAVGALVGLAVSAPAVAAVTAALGASAVLGEFAYRILRATTGATIGLYRNSHLQYRDGFGVGGHPPPPRRTYTANDLSFRYEIALEG